MSDKERQEKVAYFKEQELLDISGDENDFLDEGYLKTERALADLEAMPPPPALARQSSSFLGPTPKERRNEFEAHSTKQQTVARPGLSVLTRSATAPNQDITKSFSVTKVRQRPSSSAGVGPEEQLKDTESAYEGAAHDLIPFYKRVGVVPRELRSGKNVKSAEMIKLEPEHKQLFKGRIIYFYPNNDVSMARRYRIHKVIQLGAAWVTTWRADVTHLMVDDANDTYSQLLHHFNKAGFPKKVVLVKFDPYVPQCIQFGTVLDPTAGRFLIRGAPRASMMGNDAASSAPADSQKSLQIKRSKRQRMAESSQKTESIPTDDSVAVLAPEEQDANEDIVKDSFIASSQIPAENDVQAPNTYDDPLSEAIKETKAIAHLPLDEEEDGDSRPSSSEGQDSDSGTDEDVPEPASKRLKVSRRATAVSKGKGGVNQLTFQCMDPTGKVSATCPNARTIEILEQMGGYYNQMQDQWRTLAYRRAVTTLRKQPVKVTIAEEAAALPFIGSRLAEKIEEIVLTDRLKRLDSTRDDPTDKVLRLFLGVYGAGLIQANKWIQAGHRTLEDLVTKARLTESQKIGVEHYEDFARRVPRTEVEAHGNFVKDAMRKIDSGLTATIMGSYRRGAKDSGDIDIIITKPGASVSTLRELAFFTLVPALFKVGFLKVKLATSSRTDDGTKWHGASCLSRSSIWRRLDLLLVPEEELGAALIYFTGNDIFNRSMRLLASKRGMRLNQRGLYKDVIRGKNRERLNEGTLLEGRDEKRIFEILGVPWREPTERIC